MADTPTDTTPPDGDEPPRRRRRRLWMVVPAVLVVWAVAAVVVGLQAKRHTDQGLEAFDAVAPVATGSLTKLVDSLREPQPEGMDRPIPEELRDAADEFAAARDSLNSPVLVPVLPLPVLGRQLRSARALSDAAAQVGAAASDAYDELTELLDAPSENPTERLDAVRDARTVLQDASERIDGLDLGPDEGLVGRLSKARVRFRAEYARVTDTLDLALDAVTGLDSFLTGPSRYLLLASNNAEMRAGSGMFLQVGVLTVAEGRFTVEDLQPTRGLAAKTTPAPIDPDVAANWGPLEPNREWRNVNVTPRFDVSAQMAIEMWASMQPPVDGAISIDVAGLRALLEVVGPVEVDGRTVSADDVRKYLLLDQYVDFDDQLEREDQIESVARATLMAFNDRSWSPTDLIGSLQRAGRQRHVLLWSSDEVEQRAWTAVDAAGTVSDDSMLLAVLNRGGNKLDQFLDVTATTSVESVDAGSRVRVAIDLTNTTPDGLPTRVAGPFPGSGLSAGEYLGIVQLTIPGSSGLMEISGGEPAVLGDDGPSKVIGTQVHVLPGATTHVEFTFVVPEELTEVALLASARMPATTWNTGSKTFRDGSPRTVVVG